MAKLESDTGSDMHRPHSSKKRSQFSWITPARSKLLQKLHGQHLVLITESQTFQPVSHFRTPQIIKTAAVATKLLLSSHSDLRDNLSNSISTQQPEWLRLSLQNVSTMASIFINHPATDNNRDPAVMDPSKLKHFGSMAQKWGNYFRHKKRLGFLEIF